MRWNEERERRGVYRSIQMYTILCKSQQRPLTIYLLSLPVIYTQTHNQINTHIFFYDTRNFYRLHEQNHPSITTQNSDLVKMKKKTKMVATTVPTKKNHVGIALENAINLENREEVQLKVFKLN